jgi:hypothetical protein
MVHVSSSNLFKTSLAVNAATPLAWVGEQFISNALGDWWGRMPWGMIFIALLCFNAGFALREAHDPNSKMRIWWKRRKTFAHVSFEIERPNMIYEDQTVTAKISVSKGVQDFACYFRWAKPEYFFDGTAKWIWSQQIAICEGLNTGPGKVISETLVRISRPMSGHSSVTIGNAPVGAADSPFEGVYLLEVVTSSRGRSTRETQQVKIVLSTKPTIIPVHPSDTSRFKDE